jgi:hypothetical protein
METEETTKKIKAAFNPLNGRKSKDNHNAIMNGFIDS